MWLYDDTYLGLPVNGHRSFLHNSMVVEQGAKFTTLYNESGGNPLEYMNYGLGPRSPDWYWSYGAMLSDKTLYVAYGEYHNGDGKASVYGFVHTATVLAAFNLRTLRLERVIPVSVAHGILWGVWMVNFGAYAYIYGSAANGHQLVNYNSMYVARVATGHLASTGNWEYFNGKSFTKGVVNASAASMAAQSQFSVTRVGNVYVLATMADVFQDPDLMLYFACSPTGPFTDGLPIYDTLGHGGPYGTQGIVGVYTYGACAHVGLTHDPSQLVITYDVNSSDWSLLEDGLNIVRPRYVETTVTL